MDGKCGKNVIIHNGQEIIIGSKESVSLEKDDEVLIMTPGGGGYGRPEKLVN